MTENSVDQVVRSFIDGFVGDPNTEVERLVTEPSGLGPEEMLRALAHPDLAAAGRSLGIQLMADFMRPDGSIYFDSIYGAFHGQRGIRGWLVPTMSSISFIDFVPTMEGHLFADGAGVAGVDEWMMVVNPAAMGMEGDPIPMGRGVSVRRYSGGWIDWSCDVYDTGTFRSDPAAGLPPAPAIEWPRDASVPETRVRDFDFEADCARFHPTDSVYHDPIFGEFRGRDAISAWMLDVMPKVGDVVFESVGPVFDDGEVFVQEWVQTAVVPDGPRVPMTRGTSVRRYRDGWTVYAADYFDTATVFAPEVVAASAACGATLTMDDVLRHRR